MFLWVLTHTVFDELFDGTLGRESYIGLERKMCSLDHYRMGSNGKNDNFVN
jgi:hypothetical protein